MCFHFACGVEELGSPLPERVLSNAVRRVVRFHPFSTALAQVVGLERSSRRFGPQRWCSALGRTT